MTDKEMVTALQKCNNGKGHRCSECPALGKYNHRICKATIDKLAVNLIERLQSELTAYKSTDLTPSEIKSLLSYGECGESIIGHCNMSGIVADLKTENTRLKAERDKAVEDLKLLNDNGLCDICGFVGSCTDTEDCCFKWRGLEESE